MAWVALVTVLSLLVYLATLLMVGRARGKYEVEAPAMTGPAAFERAVRVQANTLEGMVLYLPALWLCAVYLSPRAAAALGMIWVVGRILYAQGYSQDAKKRSTGFLVQGLATVLLVLGALVGVLMALIRGQGVTEAGETHTGALPILSPGVQALTVPCRRPLEGEIARCSKRSGSTRRTPTAPSRICYAAQPRSPSVGSSQAS